MARPFNAAGTTPAAKRPPIEMFATTPMMMRSIAGGTRVETPPALGVRWPSANGARVLSFASSSGRATEPMAAVFAHRRCRRSFLRRTTSIRKDDHQAREPAIRLGSGSLTSQRASYRTMRIERYDPLRHSVEPDPRRIAVSRAWWKSFRIDVVLRKKLLRLAR